MKIGILALQGAFIEHKYILEKINMLNKYEKIETFEIRQKKDIIDNFDGLIIPGGESTTIGKLLKTLDLFDLLKEKIENGLPTFGTCAGMILLSKRIFNDKTVHLGILDIEVKRNAFGRQLGSFRTYSNFSNIENFEMIFIRGPIVTQIENNVEILSEVNNDIVAIKQNNIIATSYHPELTEDTRIHEYFINLILNNKNVL